MEALYNPPFFIKKLFNSFIWETRTNQVLLTFDDGPILENTEKILSILNKHHIKALFFLIGNNIQKNPDLVNEILNENHLIGNHSYNHAKLNSLSRKEIESEIDNTNKILFDNHGYTTRYFRPPHGKFNYKVISELKKANLTPIMWSLLTYDYKNDFNIVKFAVDNYLKSNSIIVLHDNYKSSNIIVNSIEYIIETVQNKNYEFGNPPDCF